MYVVDVRIRGTAPLLQHKFPIKSLEGLMDGASRQTGAPDYSLEWLDSMYSHAGYLYQPASHIEGSLVRAAAGFKIKGARGRTYRDLIRASCYVQPDMLWHLRDGQRVAAPGPDLLRQPDPFLSVSIMRVLVQRSAVARSRLQIATGWELHFSIEVVDEQLRPDVVQTILTEAGATVAIGDFRPRYGRYVIEHFQVRAPAAPAPHVAQATLSNDQANPSTARTSA